MIELVGLGAVLVFCLKGRWLHGLNLVMGGAAVMWMAYRVGVADHSGLLRYVPGGRP